MKFDSVSVITAGPALGHGVTIDSKTLDLVSALGNNEAPVKVFPDHDESVTDLIGAMTNFRVEGDQVKADLELIAEHPLSGYYGKILDVFPESLGFSISWEGTTETVDGQEYCRPSGILSVDLVSRPAANPQGVYSARTAPRKKLSEVPKPVTSVDNPEKVTMSNDTVPAVQQALAAEDLASALAPIAAAISALSDKIDAFIANDPVEDAKEIAEAQTGEMAAKLDAVITKLSVLEEAGRGTDPVDGEPGDTASNLVAKFESLSNDRERFEFATKHPEIRTLVKNLA